MCVCLQNMQEKMSLVDCHVPHYLMATLRYTAFCERPKYGNKTLGIHLIISFMLFLCFFGACVMICLPKFPLVWSFNSGHTCRVVCTYPCQREFQLGFMILIFG